MDARGCVDEGYWSPFEFGSDNARRSFLGIAKPTPEGRRMMEARAKLVKCLFGGERFVPEHGEEYWYVHYDGSVGKSVQDDMVIASGNCFRTEAESRGVSNAMKEYAEALREYHKTL